MRGALLGKLVVVRLAFFFKARQVQREERLHLKAQELANVTERLFFAPLELLMHSGPNKG